MSQLPEFTGPAGAAFLLSEAASLSIDIDHPEGRVIVREGAPQVTVNLLNSHDAGKVKAVAWRVIQESFDLLAAKRRAALSTAMGDAQCVLWSRNGDQYDVTCVVTFTSRWSINVNAATGGTGSVPSQQSFKHHNALRFYRMSQCANSLFDAYRNAYLALECLVSDVAPKRKGKKRKGKRGETELEWLIRAIKGPLADAVPPGMDVKSTLKAVYRDGRLPLFHAKTDRAKAEETFYTPQGAETEKVQRLFERLTLLLVSLLQYKLGKEVVRRWATMSRSMQDAGTLPMFDFDEVRFEQGSDEISVSPRIKVVDSPRRFGQLWAKVAVARPGELQYLKKVLFLRDSKWCMQFELDETVEMSQVASVTFEINSDNRNLFAPRAIHPE